MCKTRKSVGKQGVYFGWNVQMFAVVTALVLLIKYNIEKGEWKHRDRGVLHYKTV
jgi:hypothetical protein